jgi:hypothetical protein
MGFGEQLTMLIVLIVVLGVAYFAITTWSKRAEAKQASAPKAGTGLGDDEFDAAGDLREALKDRDAVAKRREQRFQLTGKDAEVAAKVLKRMLRQDRDGA